ncbi:hypothetical protein ACLK11_00470 [Escherichia coli]
MRLSLLALAFLLGRVAWLQVISPDMLVKETGTWFCFAFSKFPPPAGIILTISVIMTR